MNARRFAPLIVALLALAGCDLFRSADSRVARAERSMAEHRYREALIDLKNALEDEPGHMKGRLRLAAVEMQLGDLAGAEKDLSRAIELGAPPAETAEIHARLQLALGKARELLAEIEAGKTGLEKNAAALYRGQALVAVRDLPAAIEALQAIPRGDPRWVAARATIAEALAGQGNTDAALSELSAVIAVEPAGYEAWLTRGTVHARLGDFAAAEQDLGEARKHMPADLASGDQARLLASLGEVELALGKVDAATATQGELARVAPNALVTQVLAARIALARQDYSAATAMLQRAVTMAPNMVTVRFLLGAALFAQGNLGQAEQQLSQVVQSAPENLAARKMLAQVQLKLGHADSALQLLQGAEGAHDPQLDMLLGVAQLQRGQQPSALAYLEKAAAANPTDAKLRLDLAAAYLSAGQPGKSVELLAPMKQSPDELRRAGLLAAALLASGDVPRAREQIDALIAARPKDATALMLGVEFNLQQRDFARARGLAQRALDAAPQNPQLLLARARVEARAGKADDASQWIDKALALDPGNAAAHLAQAELAMRRGDVVVATRALEDLRRRDNGSIDARLQLAAIYLRQKNAAAAQPVIDELTALAKDRPDILNSLGMLLFENGRYDVALSRFRDAALRDSTNPVYWLNAARAQIALGDSGVARESLQKAVAARPDWMPAVGTLALLDATEGRGDQALKRVSELKSAHPHDANALQLEGDVHMAMREYAKAAAAYSAAVAISPSSATALKIYQARNAGGLPAATEPLERWLAAHPDEDTLRMVLAQAYQGKGELRRSAQEYETIRAAGRATPVVLNNLAWNYHLLHDPQALTVAKQAYDSSPKASAIADTYGWILVENDRAAEALPVLQAAAKDSRDPATQYHYAVALVRTGAREEGLKLLREVLAREPKFEGAADARKLLEQESGR
jgi:cellulose synthase operon protein C